MDVLKERNAVVWRSMLNWVNGSTLMGLIVARMGRCTIRRGANKLWLAEHYAYSFPVAGAFTIGNVIITATTFEALERRNPQATAHEARHCTQYACLGTLFLPIYVLSMGISWVLTGDWAAQNPLEKWAGLDDGGYDKVPMRRWLPGSRQPSRES